MADFWEFPGGKIEPGETPESCIIREIKEELGIATKPKKVLTKTFFSYPEIDVDIIFLQCESDDISEIKHIGVADSIWVTPEEAAKMKIIPADFGFLEWLKNNISA